MEFIGSGSAVERLWTKPSLTITGIDAPKVDGASNTLVASARAKISLRIAPGDTTESAIECLRTHLEAHVPWGAELGFTVVDTGEATMIDASGPAYDAARDAFTEAWDGTRPIDMGVGGSIPFIAEFLESFPEASVLVTGVEDPDTRAHGANEGLHLAEFERVCLAEALMLANLAEQQWPAIVTLSTEAVLELLQSVAAEVITPRFRSLSSAQIDEKKPGDLVTVADHESEELITRALLDAYPDAVVLGEEAYAGDKDLMPRFRAAEHGFTVDPVDGTKNFVNGSPDHAVMVAEVVRGETVRGWIWQPEHELAMVAERGGGVRRNGEPVVSEARR